MNRVSLVVNGTAHAHEVEPRTHLGDFLRDTLRLTGTHLGCEHGVCGACTVLIDGEPVRSCITYAVACEGRRITTIEGHGADPVMSRLRSAFHAHHALQCGYCTPGMLATARDIVLRLPDADEARVRLELAGNLCRCTGYMGIVAAILDVLAQCREQADPRIEALRAAIRASARADADTDAPTIDRPGAASRPSFETAAALAASPPGLAAPPGAAGGAPTPGAESTGGRGKDAPAGTQGAGTVVQGEFVIGQSPERVWAFMGDLEAVAACLPGASIDAHEGDRVNGRISIKFGPMSAAFVGAARLERDEATRSAVLRGAGQDSLSRSRAQGDVGYRLVELDDGATRVHVELRYTLQGPLAQFSRSGLVRDFVRRMIADFGRNVGNRMVRSEQSGDACAAVGSERGAASMIPSGPGTTAADADPLGSTSSRVLAAILWERLRRAIGFGR